MPSILEFKSSESCTQKCVVYYPDQQMHNICIYIKNILYVTYIKLLSRPTKAIYIYIYIKVQNAYKR